MEPLAVERDPEGIELQKFRRFARPGPARRSRLSSGDRVLEIGAGNGRLIWQYGLEVALVYGIDTEATKLRDALRVRPKGLVGKTYFTLAQAEALPFRNASFDLAVLGWSL